MATLPGIIPRWEWRTFGDLGPAEALLTSLVAGNVDESDEVYLLSRRGDASVKARAGLLDVKTLEAVDDGGLELWIPRIKAMFPVGPDVLSSVFTTLEVAAPELSRIGYTIDQLTGEVVRAVQDVRATPVHKQRARTVVDGCMVELTQMEADGSSIKSVAVESSDPAHVAATVRRLGLDGRPNTCVARGLKHLVGWGVADRFAVIDVGTNSVKLHVAEQMSDGSARTLVDRAVITRLGEALAESERLSAAAIQRTVEAIAEMVDEARRSGVVDIAAVGTAGLRQAHNSAELVAAVKARCAITVDVISGEEEAQLAYLAATSTLPVAGQLLVVFDSGGGSSQFTFGKENRIEEQFSIDVGAVRVTERHALAGAVSSDSLVEALAAIAADLDRLDGRERRDGVVAMGGTATNLAAVKHGLERYEPDVVHGTVLDLAEIDRQIELYRTRGADRRREIPGLQPARAEVILGGACIVRTILTKLGQQSMLVSDRGLRHGVFAQRFQH